MQQCWSEWSGVHWDQCIARGAYRDNYCCMEYSIIPFEGVPPAMTSHPGTEFIKEIINVRTMTSTGVPPGYHITSRDWVHQRDNKRKDNDLNSCSHCSHCDPDNFTIQNIAWLLWLSPQGKPYSGTVRFVATVMRVVTWPQFSMSVWLLASLDSCVRYHSR